MPDLPLIDCQVLATLVALAHAPRIDAAAKPCALLDRAFSQTLAMLQTALRVPTRMDRGRAALLLQTMLNGWQSQPETKQCQRSA